MGTISSTRWKPPSDLYLVIDYKYCLVWQSRSDQTEHMEEYRVSIHNQEEMERYQNMFVMRIEQCHFPITMYFVIDRAQYICNDAKIGSVLIERIPYRLCQLAQIPYHWTISILFHCFNAYHVLHRTYGLFTVLSTMIGFDRFYQVKVWHHPQLSNPVPFDSYCHTLTDMLNSIVTAVSNISQVPSSQPQTFPQYLKNRSIILQSYHQSITILKRYCTRYNITITQHFPLIGTYHLKAQEQSLPTLRNACSRMKLLTNTQRNQERSVSGRSVNSSTNKGSLGKYSFKKNTMVDNQQTDNQNEKSLYYGNSNRTVSKSNSASLLTPIRKLTQFSGFDTPIQKISINDLRAQSKTPPQNNNQNDVTKQRKTPLTFQRHLKAAPITNRFQPPPLSPQKPSKVVNQFIPYSPTPLRSTIQQSPSCKTIATHPDSRLSHPVKIYSSGSTNSQSDKSILSSNSIQLVVEKGCQSNTINMLKQK